MAKKKTAMKKASTKTKTKKAVKTAPKAAKPAVRTAKARKATEPSLAPSISAKQQFLGVLAKEHPTTLKVMKAFPASEGAFQPHPRSHSAKRLMWTFVQEQDIALGALKGTLTMPPKFGPEPATLDEVMAAYERGVKELTDCMNKTHHSRLAETSPFFVGPGKMADVPVIDLLWMMLMDSIHHRGQLSVYTRMAGGKVPSIYGPSADEPWM